MIEVPAKIWQPKVVSRHTVPDYEGEDIDNILNYKQYGRCVYRNRLAWSDNSKRTDVIILNEKDHLAELEKDIKFGEDINLNTKEAIKKVVKDFWDRFITVGAKHIILGYKFGIDTSGAKPVCCRNSLYVPYESKVILQ